MTNRISKTNEDRPGFKKIFRAWRTNPLTGEREYPKHARCFVFYVPDEDPAE